HHWQGGRKLQQCFRVFPRARWVATLRIFILRSCLEEPEADRSDFSKEGLGEILGAWAHPVSTDDDCISYTLNDDQHHEELNIAEKELEDEENQDSNEEDENEDNTVEYTLEITSGMMPHEVIA